MFVNIGWCVCILIASIVWKKSLKWTACYWGVTTVLVMCLTNIALFVGAVAVADVCASPELFFLRVVAGSSARAAGNGVSAILPVRSVHCSEFQVT